MFVALVVYTHFVSASDLESADKIAPWRKKKLLFSGTMAAVSDVERFTSAAPLSSSCTSQVRKNERTIFVLLTARVRR
jgi:hypothetical protein